MRYFTGMIDVIDVIYNSNSRTISYPLPDFPQAFSHPKILSYTTQTSNGGSNGDLDSSLNATIHSSNPRLTLDLHANSSNSDLILPDPSSSSEFATTLPGPEGASIYLDTIE